MIAAFVILVVIGLIATIAVAGFLRSVVADESRTEARLRSPAVPTVMYELPNGVDPAVVKVALARAGFTCMADEARATETLRVECDAGERERVRRVIEGVAMSDYNGSSLKVDHVVFDDER